MRESRKINVSCLNHTSLDRGKAVITYSFSNTYDRVDKSYSYSNTKMKCVSLYILFMDGSRSFGYSCLPCRPNKTIFASS